MVLVNLTLMFAMLTGRETSLLISPGARLTPVACAGQVWFSIRVSFSLLWSLGIFTFVFCDVHRQAFPPQDHSLHFS